jgi:hypothetical protein
MLTTHLRLEPSLGMSVAIPLLLLYAFLAWRGKTLTFVFLSAIRVPVQDSLQLGDYLGRENRSVSEKNAWIVAETYECREYKYAVDSKCKEVCFR